MASVKKLTCVKCNRVYNEKDGYLTCPKCGIDGILDVHLDEDQMQATVNHHAFKNNIDFSMWRYLPVLPLHGISGIQPLHVGWTPLYTTHVFEAEFGLSHLIIKDDSRNPTASLKDRASAVGVARAVEGHHNVVCAASTGNAATSLSGFSACAGLKTYIFVPETAPEAKIAQLLIFGATVFLVQGTYDTAVELCWQAAQDFGWYNRSCAINPYLVEGKKTVAYEICEQLLWEAPDIVVVAVGDGCTVAGVCKGLSECFSLGLIEKMPKVVGVQASGANPVSRAFTSGDETFSYRTPETIADSISVGIPRNGVKALRGIRAANGYMVDVSDDEILSAMRILARKMGIFGEPAGVAAFAGVLKMKELHLIQGDEHIAVIVSGSGLKDIRSALKACGKGISMPPDIEAVRAYVKAE